MSADRATYLSALRSQLEPNIVNHSLALEACMGGIYDYLQGLDQLGSDELPKEDWMLAGLTHDIDFGGEFKEEHPHKTKEALAKYGLEVSEGVYNMIQAHAAGVSGVTPKSKGEWAIFCADSLTGLIMAVAFVYPSRKLADVKLSSIMKRFFKEPKFAAGTRRNEVAKCADPNGLNIPVEKFIEICFESMKKIAGDIGL